MTPKRVEANKKESSFELSLFIKDYSCTTNGKSATTRARLIAVVNVR